MNNSNFSRNRLLYTLSSEKLSELLKGTDITTLNQKYTGYYPPGEHTEEVIALRKFYPELFALTEQAIFDLYDDYMSDCNFIGGFSTPNGRENGFTFYVLGKHINSRLEGAAAQNCGEKFIFEKLPKAMQS